MTVLEALRGGMRGLARHKGVTAVFYAATTAAALLIAAPAMSIAIGSLGESAWAHEMAGNLDAAWLSELAAAHGSLPVAPVLAVLTGVGAVWLVVYLFLLGGAIEALCAGGSFFGGCGRNFWRMVRLALISAVFYVVVWMVYRLLGAVGRKIWGEGSEATPMVHWGWFSAAAALCLAGLVNVVFDYARVLMVAEGRRSSWGATFAAFGFVRRNAGRTVGLYVLVCAIAAALFAAYLAVSHTVAQSSMALVLVLFLARQAMVLAKIWSRLLFYSTAWEMYGALRPAPPAPPEPEPVCAAAEPEADAAATPEGAAESAPHAQQEIQAHEAEDYVG